MRNQKRKFIYIFFFSFTHSIKKREDKLRPRNNFHLNLFDLKTISH